MTKSLRHMQGMQTFSIAAERGLLQYITLPLFSTTAVLQLRCSTLQYVTVQYSVSTFTVGRYMSSCLWHHSCCCATNLLWLTGPDGFGPDDAHYDSHSHLKHRKQHCHIISYHPNIETKTCPPKSLYSHSYIISNRPFFFILHSLFFLFVLCGCR